MDSCYISVFFVCRNNRKKTGEDTLPIDNAWYAQRFAMELAM